ncbi:hypothetical protein BSZ35_05620 [Salinibacter sp. 10B]|uniref:phosphatidylinositol-specific phospholipase C1-like protein n=1 Tax=Salinibacter sp. 10B TaxID=1923971 RepID=UPI000D2AF605|nr:phosphatidylinositol-specific phospholipase C1-like protein [Salinibacter sp. 10B]PQJ34148.1 hypothetical protein BSZ35_05620 [Salinibacter sp. 10B]
MNTRTVLVGLFLSLAVGSLLLLPPPAPAQSPPSLRLNDLQVLGSHNSYKAAIDSSLMQILRQRRPETARALDYAHPPLQEQLQFGLRSLELDVYYDPNGGRYADPYGRTLVKKQGLPPGAPYDPNERMDTMGFKVLHVQGLDFRSNCLTFQRCLREVQIWSTAHPRHVSIIITLNAKDDSIGRPGFTEPLPFDSTAFAALDAEIRSVFSADELITPDDVRGTAPTLRAAVRNEQWPLLSEARGHVLFVLDETGRKLEAYRKGHPSLQGRAMFADAPEDSPEAAFHIVNEPIEHGDQIRRLVREGYLVRTRADANTVEARTGNIRRREAAFASGAHVISTDYYRPDPELGTGYKVSLPGGKPARCNPVTAPPECQTDDLHK